MVPFACEDLRDCREAAVRVVWEAGVAGHRGVVESGVRVRGVGLTLGMGTACLLGVGLRALLLLRLMVRLGHSALFLLCGRFGVCLVLLGWCIGVLRVGSLCAFVVLSAW